nr:hypothetical protein OG999_34205 [Streptomyces sp. NBC_00886]
MGEELPAEAAAALEEAVERKKRPLAVARLAARPDAGDFDLLLDKENYRRQHPGGGASSPSS